MQWLNDIQHADLSNPQHRFYTYHGPFQQGDIYVSRAIITGVPFAPLDTGTGTNRKASLALQVTPPGNTDGVNTFKYNPVLPYVMDTSVMQAWGLDEANVSGDDWIGVFAPQLPYYVPKGWTIKFLCSGVYYGDSGAGAAPAQSAQTWNDYAQSSIWYQYA